MVNPLYAVSAITCALVVLILSARTGNVLNRKESKDRAFLNLINWTALFCMSDGIWGIIASDLIMNDALLMVFSFIFHLFASFTPLVWLHFILSFLETDRRCYLYGFSNLLFVAETTILIINFWKHNVFTVFPDGSYHSAPMRQFLFYAQYVNYVAVAIVSLIHLADKRKKVKNYWAVLTFVGAPILAGFFQQLYPDAPAYSIGYTLGCCIIYSFVVTGIIKMRLLENLQMDQANKAKTTFLNNMSHDIRTPLNAITGFNSLALGALGHDNDKVRDYLTKIGIASDALLTIINDILEISRIEAGKVTVTEVNVNVMSSFDRIEPITQELAANSGIDLEFSYGNIDDKFVACDSAHCERVFINLVTNAIKYTPRGGKVQVSCSQTGYRDDGYGIYTYTFKDNGIGMSESFQKQLFKEFSRENTLAVNKIQGTGLGLALSKNLVELMGGTISCVSKQGQGSTFTVVLPFRLLDSQDCGQLTDNTTETEDILTGKNILLVEDNELNREIAQVILNEMGACVTEAYDGNVAVEMMKTDLANKLDLILMDIQMPMLDGYEATRQIRAIGGKSAQIPIIAMTANAFEEDRKAALEAGMNGHVAKPIDIDSLVSTLKKVLH